MAELYKPYTSADAQGVTAGYKFNAWIALPEWITTEAEPSPGSTPVMGDHFRITTAHVFASGKGALPVYMFPKTAESTGEATGDQGAKGLSFKPKIFIAGDNAKSLELVKNIVNKPVLLWMEKESDTCPGTIVQFGCTCTPCFVDAVANASGTTGSGKAGYEVTFETQQKYFYEASLTLYP